MPSKGKSLHSLHTDRDGRPLLAPANMLAILSLQKFPAGLASPTTWASRRALSPAAALEGAAFQSVTRSRQPEQSTADAMAGAAERPAANNVCSVCARRSGIEVAPAETLDVKNRAGTFLSYIELHYSSWQAGLRVPPRRQGQ